MCALFNTFYTVSKLQLSVLKTVCVAYGELFEIENQSEEAQAHFQCNVNDDGSIRQTPHCAVVQSIQV